MAFYFSEIRIPAFVNQKNKLYWLSAIDNWPFFFSFNEWCSSKRTVDRTNFWTSSYNHLSYWDMRNMPEGPIFLFLLNSEFGIIKSNLLSCSHLELYKVFFYKKINISSSENIDIYVPMIIIFDYLLLFIEINHITRYVVEDICSTCCYFLNTNSKVITEI